VHPVHPLHPLHPVLVTPIFFRNLLNFAPSSLLVYLFVYYLFTFLQCKLWYYKGNYSMFKKMVVQKRRELVKEYEKQERRIKDLKASGQSKKKAEAKTKVVLTRKAEKNKSKMQKNDDETGLTELLERPREYVVKFRFPETSQLQPPILGLYNASFNSPIQLHLFTVFSQFLPISPPPPPPGPPTFSIFSHFPSIF
jgi:hypothetical protein